jgi:hypothetical protein
MKININIKKTFKINGKEYHSLDEMPDAIRELFNKAQQHQSGHGTNAGSSIVRTKILFNGTEYASIDTMPSDVRRLYEKVMNAAATGGSTASADIADMVEGISSDRSSQHPSEPMRPRESPMAEPSFSPKSLFVGALVLGFIVLLYFLFKR